MYTRVLRINVLIKAVWFIIGLTFSIQSLAEDADDAEALFVSLCASCHGETGDGNGPIAETLALKPRDFALAAFKFDADADWETGTDTDLASVIRQGPGAYGGSLMMPAFAHLSDVQVASLIQFVRSRER
jgi:mono/diheme cytochrome c family protein